MLNYLKSEFYRILHGREIYSATAALAGLTVLMNLVLFAFDRLKYEVSVNMSGYRCLWDTPEGAAKCLIAGAIGILIFYAAGILAFRKREIS